MRVQALDPCLGLSESDPKLYTKSLKFLSPTCICSGKIVLHKSTINLDL
jgi:hypothetical protein